jgi:tight adherence protein C
MPSPFSAVPLPLLVFVALLALAVGAAGYAVVGERQRRALLRRATGTFDLPPRVRGGRGVGDRLLDWLAARVSAPLGGGTATASKLVQAGWDTEVAPALFAVARVASVIAIPVASQAVAPRQDPLLYPLSIVLGLLIGVLGPVALLDRAVAARQATIRRGIPDTLDLLVVCVEAGVALDAALQRVAREMGSVHPVLAGELLVLSRRVAAGMPREQAMQGLYLRTGVEELRSLSSHMIQSERWGTSIARVLRIYAEQLRRKRKVAAERRAATASTRMLLPLALFIFPTIFIVLLGPAAMSIVYMFEQMNK